MKSKAIPIKKNGRCPSCNNLIVRDHRSMKGSKYYDLKGIVVNGNIVSGHCRICRVLLEVNTDKPKAIMKRRGSKANESSK